MAGLMADAERWPTVLGCPDRSGDPGGLVVVAGLGAMGQACLLRLLDFDVELRGLALERPGWRDPVLERRLDANLVIGDMRQPQRLREAGVEQASAVLLLSSTSTVNFEAALQVRLINPCAEIVVRSSSQQADFGTLLEQRLPGVAVVDPLLLTAGAIVAALRPGRQAAVFRVEEQGFGIIEASLQDRRFQRTLRLPSEAEDTRPMLVTPIGLTGSGEGQRRSATLVGSLAQLVRKPLVRLRLLLQQRSPLQLLLGATLLMLALGGMRLFAGVGDWKQGVFVTLALLKGEYVDPVNVMLEGLGSIQQASGWLIAGTLLYSLIGTLLTSLLVGVILEWLLRERLGLSRPRRLRRGAPVVVLLGGGSLADEVELGLRREHCAVVRVEDGVGGSAARLEEALSRLDGHRVTAVGLLSSDLLRNLHGALALQEQCPGTELLVLAFSVGASEQLGALLGGVTVISTTDMVADAIVATAFGERVEGVWRLRGRTLLLVRYRISHGDTLCGQSVARLENGYALTAVALKRLHSSRSQALPGPDLRLADGDQVVVLATLPSLRRVQLGDSQPPGWQVRLQVAGSLVADRRFELQQCLARWIGGQPGDMLTLLDGQEHTTAPLDHDISDLLASDLGRLGARAWVEPIPACALGFHPPSRVDASGREI